MGTFVRRYLLALTDARRQPWPGPVRTVEGRARAGYSLGERYLASLTRTTLPPRAADSFDDAQFAKRSATGPNSQARTNTSKPNLSVGVSATRNIARPAISAAVSVSVIVILAAASVALGKTQSEPIALGAVASLLVICIFLVSYFRHYKIAAAQASAVTVTAAIALIFGIAIGYFGARTSFVGSGSTPVGTETAAAAASRERASVWVASQVSRAAIVACDPLMCQRLAADGFPPSNLLVLAPTTSDPLGSDIVIATPAVRAQFGARLSTVYAPSVLASFGRGIFRIDIRLTYGGGAALYNKVLSAGIAAARSYGRALLGFKRITLTSLASRQLAGGRVDSRVSYILRKLAIEHAVFIVAFGDIGPRSSYGVPLRSVELTLSGHRSYQHARAHIYQIIGFLKSQHQPLRPSRIWITTRLGHLFLHFEFPAPSPIGPNPLPGQGPPPGPP